MMFKGFGCFIEKASKGFKVFSKTFDKNEKKTKKIMNENVLVTSDIVFNLIQHVMQKNMYALNVSYSTDFLKDTRITEEGMLDLLYEIQNNLLPDGFVKFVVDNELLFVTVGDMVTATLAFYTSKQYEKMRSAKHNQKTR